MKPSVAGLQSSGRCLHGSCDFVVSSAPQEQSGAASALSETVSEFGGALGIALLGSLSTLLYRHSLASVMPADVTSYDADTALRGIGAASDLAQGSHHAAKLLSAAQHSYASSIQVTFIAAALITFATAILAVTMFNARRMRPAAEA